MNTLSDALDKAIEQIPRLLIGDVLSKSLQEQGITLSERKKRHLVEKILEGRDGVQFHRWHFWKRSSVIVELTQQDQDNIIRRLDDILENRVPGLVESVSQDLAASILPRLRRQWPAHWRAERRQRGGFERRLERQWTKPLGLLRMALMIAREAGSHINQQLRSKPTDSPNMLEVLTRLHARSCQICDEVLTLLGAGLADGAMARWRTLHEVSVVALFIQQHGEELATRYVEHEIVEAFRAAREYHERQDQLGYEPITDEELGRLKLNYEAVLRKYGDPFATQYGWAAHHLDNRRPSIASIEYAIGTGHLRPHYRLASHNVHPNPKGVFFKLGLLQETAVLLAGPSNAGLDEPGPSTALSLLKATMPLAMMNPTLDTVVVLNILTALEREIGAAFVEAARRLQEKAHLHANEP